MQIVENLELLVIFTFTRQQANSLACPKLMICENGRKIWQNLLEFNETHLV